MLIAFWFGVIAVLWAGYFVLEGFDFGVGMLLPFVARDEEERGLALRSIGPVWDGNEVWLLVAGGATFAAFPEWYASLFSGFYLAFALLLLGLILRGIGIEYRGKAETSGGRRWCDAAVVVGSFLPALLVGVTFADFVRGVQLNSEHVVTGSFWDLLTPYALLGGVASVSLFAFHGATFLGIRVDGTVGATARAIARRFCWVAGLLGGTLLAAGIALRSTTVSTVVAVLLVFLLIGAIRATLLARHGWAFAMTSVAVGVIPVWVFSTLWPNVLPARNGATLALTAHQASSSHYTLVVMTVVALLVTPVVLAYQAWTYWVFRARIGAPVAGSGGSGLPDRARHAASGAAAPPRDEGRAADGRAHPASMP